MQSVSKKSTTAAPAIGAIKATKAVPSTKLFAVASTAVMPYSDDGPAGCGLLLECVKTEQEAVQTAIKFLKTYASEIMPTGTSSNLDYSHKERAEQLCEDGLKLTSFEDLSLWFSEFAGTISDYLQKEQEERYMGGSNVGESLNLHIKDALTDSNVFIDGAIYDL